MGENANTTPLIALDALVIDTETTGLDAAKAWLVEIAALPLSGGKLGPDAVLQRRFRPGEPIPATATAIHGIDDAAVAAAPTFAEIAADVAEGLGNRVLIGHAVGFDLAVLKREFARAGRPWIPPRALDTRLLAQIAEPGLAGYALENLAAWLSVEVSARHSARGDAETAGHVFLALVPKLRAVGVRTLAEAERACRALTDALDSQHRAGWVEPNGPGEAAEPYAGRRIDSQPYRYRIGEIMRSPPSFIAPDAPAGTALERLMRERISSLYVHRDAGAGPASPLETGIVTERDILRALARDGAAALAAPVSELASKPLSTVPVDAFAFLGVARMNRLGIRHLGVTDAQGHVAGALSARDLLRLRAEGAASLGDEIDDAPDVPALARAWAQLPQISGALRGEDMSGRQIAAVISRQLCGLTQRAGELAEQRMRSAGQGGPPCPYALAVLGSAGRGESLLAMDQDNALVFAEGAPDGPEDAWFEQFGRHVADILHEVGVPYCKGGVMARNPQWRGSVATWRTRIGHWIGRSNPQDLLSVDIFFDLHGVHGDVALSQAIWRAAFDTARGQVAFAKLLVEAAGTVEPGLTLLRTFRTDRGRIDLKKTGLFGVVGAARVLAICHHVLERSTPARLDGIKALGIGGASDLDALSNAQATFLDLLLAQQIADTERGIPPSNAVEVKRLSRGDRERLRDAFNAVAPLADLTRDLLFKG